MVNILDMEGLGLKHLWGPGKEHGMFCLIFNLFGFTCVTCFHRNPNKHKLPETDTLFLIYLFLGVALFNSVSISFTFVIA